MMYFLFMFSLLNISKYCKYAFMSLHIINYIHIVYETHVGGLQHKIDLTDIKSLINAL